MEIGDWEGQNTTFQSKDTWGKHEKLVSEAENIKSKTGANTPMFFRFVCFLLDVFPICCFFTVSKEGFLGQLIPECLERDSFVLSSCIGSRIRTLTNLPARLVSLSLCVCTSFHVFLVPKGSLSF